MAGRPLVGTKLAFKNRLERTSERRLRDLFAEITKRVTESRLTDFSPLLEVQKNIDAALDRFHEAIPPLWAALAEVPAAQRLPLMDAITNLLGTSVVLSSHVDHVRAPVLRDDKRRAKGAQKKREKAAPRIERLKTAIPKMAADLETSVSQSEKFYERCVPLFPSYLKPEDLQKDWPSLSNFKTIVRSLQKENRSAS